MTGRSEIRHYFCKNLLAANLLRENGFCLSPPENRAGAVGISARFHRFKLPPLAAAIEHSDVVAHRHVTGGIQVRTAMFATRPRALERVELIGFALIRVALTRLRNDRAGN